MIARTRRRTLSLLSLGVLVLIALVPRDTAAQVLYGSVVGDVKDATGGALPGATLVITSTDRGFSREAVTDAAGHFTFSNLPAGVYALKAQQQGFKGFEQKEVTVTINAVIRVDVTLEVGNIGETVTADVHDTLVAAELQNAPVPLGRNYQQMYRLLPGFAPPINSHSIPSNPSRSLEFTVNGTSDDQNNTRIDGVSTANVQLPHVSSYVPTLEAIDEVNVVTSSMGAEQGLAGGAAINLRTKSGTNAFHGSGFEYL